jgi:ferrous-iron efflux pump FieF
MRIMTDDIISTQELNARMMRRATLYSLLVGLFLVCLKTGAWLATGSLSMMSSLADSLLDVIASAINFVAIRYALMPADHDHRFGHGKAEDLATLAQSAFICGSAVFLVVEAGRRLFTPLPTAHGGIGIAVMMVSLLCTLALVLYQKRVIRRTESPLVAADSLHYFTDFLMNGTVIVSIILTNAFGWTLADPIFAILIAVWLMVGAVKMALSAFDTLMDREFSDPERESIKRTVRTTQGVLGIHELRTRRSGITQFIQFHRDLDERMSLRAAHDIATRVEVQVQQLFPKAEILIHQDPRQVTENGFIRN